MRASKSGKVVYISDRDVFLVRTEDGYGVYNKYNGGWLGRAFDEDVPDFMKFRVGGKDWEGKKE